MNISTETTAPRSECNSASSMSPASPTCVRLAEVYSVSSNQRQMSISCTMALVTIISREPTVWSNAPVIVGAHDTGPMIRSKEGFWLAIPTPAAGKSTRGGRITPGEWERRTGLRLRFVFRRRGPSLLVAEGRLNSKGRAVASRAKTGRGLTTVPIFLLVPQVKLRKRLDLARDAERAIDGVPGRIVAGWIETRS